MITFNEGAYITCVVFSRVLIKVYIVSYKINVRYKINIFLYPLVSCFPIRISQGQRRFFYCLSVAQRVGMLMMKISASVRDAATEGRTKILEAT